MKTFTLLRRAAPTSKYCPARPGRWLASLLLVLASPAAFAQLSGAYTINSAQPTGGTNYISFTAAATALTTSGVSGPVTFAVSGGPYTEQINLAPITGTSATNRVTFNGGGRTIQFGSGATAQRAVITLSGADYVTLNNLVVDPTVGTSSTSTYGWGIQLVNSSDYAVISNCTVMCSVISTSANHAGIVSSASTTSATGTGTTASRNLTITGNTIIGGYYGISVIGSGAAATPTPGTVISNNTVQESYLYGIYTTYLGGAQIIGNDVARPTRSIVSSLFGISLGAGVSGAAVEKNRVHQAFTAVPASSNSAYGIYVNTGTAATATTPNDVVNNAVYDLGGTGSVYGLYNGTSRYARYYHNTVDLTNQANTGSGDATGFYQATGLGVEFRNNVLNIGRSGTGVNYAVYLSASTGTTVSNNNDLAGTGNFVTGFYNGTAYPTLASWRTANSAAYDQASTGAAPQFVGPATGNLQPTANPLNNTAAPLTRVTDDITGAVRGPAPDMGAYEFAPVANDVALVSIDSPAVPVGAGVTPMTLTVRNNGSAPLTSVRLEYVLNGGPAVGQTFALAGAGLAPAASQALTFTVPATLVAGTNTLLITGSLPNGQPDGLASNNTLSLSLYTSIGGAYTINSAQPTGGTNFTSFTAAVAALMAGGVSAPVTFAVSGGPYTEQISIGQFIGASAARRVTFNGNGRTIQFGSNNSNRSAVITLNGADFVTIDNLVVDATVGGTSTAAYGWGVQLLNNADDNVINNCVVTTNIQQSSVFFAGIVSSADAGNINAYGALASQRLTLTNNQITGGYFGISVFGSDATATSGMVISNNTVRDFYSYGIFVGYLSGAQLIGNDISRPTRPVPSYCHGIHLDAGMRGTAVEKNRIHQTFGGAPTSSQDSYGIYVNTGADAPATSPNDFVNNLVYDLNGTGSVYGFYSDASDNARFYHNTINLDNQANTNASQAYGFYQTTGTGVEFRNNIVHVTRSGTAPNYGVYLESATGTTVSNNNNLTGGGNSFQTGFYNGVAYPTLASWQAANSGTYDQNSSAVAPQFVSVTTGNLQPSVATLNNTAAPLARVTDDITGAVRGAAPDMGAYEFAPVANDVALVSIDSPAAPVTAGSHPVTVTIRNNGGGLLTTVRLQYVLNGGTAVGQTFTLSPGLASGATTALSFTTPGVIVAGANTLTVTGSLPNGQPDADATNNTLTTTVAPALSGTYTINQLLPTGGTNFISFTAAATALNAAGIIGAVRFNVLSGPYVEQFSLGLIPGVSATDTVVVDGGTAKQTLRYTGTAAQPAAVLLNGTDFVTLNNLTIDASAGTTYGLGVHLVGQANNNRVSNCVITASTSLTSSFINASIVASGAVTVSNAAGDANNLRIENNVLTQGHYGIILKGLGIASRSTGLRVTGNTVRDFFATGISVENTAGARLLDNDISRPTRATVSSFTGILLGGNAGLAVENNRIHDDFTANRTSTAGTFGIYSSDNNGTAGNENDVVNNVLYNFTGAGDQYAIFNASSSYMRYYHNTVSMDNPLFTGPEQCYGFYQTATATNIEFRNNLVSVTRPGSGVRYAVFLENTASGVVSNHNDLYLGTGTNYYTGHYGTLDFLTLANWRTANGGAFDQNSLQVAPLFAAPATANFLPAEGQLNGTGNPATLARVPRDITGLPRTSPPDPGAYELTLVPNDVAVLSIDAPAVTGVLGSNPVVVTIRNNGSSVLSSVVLSYVLNTGTPVAQTFTGLNLALGASRQLTFSTGLVVAISGTLTLTVTGSLPNGLPDGNAVNNSQTITFFQPTLPNDEPCGAVALGTSPTTGSNVGATTSVQNGINTPACSGGALPNDVWFAFTPSGTSTTITLTGTPAGAVRVFSSPGCSAGPFTQVFCQGSGIANTALGSVLVPGLTAGTRYYVAVSGHGSGDATGSFTIAATALLGTKAPANPSALLVYPNPSNTGQLTLSLTGVRGAGTVELLNVLGQAVLRQPLATATEQPLSTRGLAAGLYTLRVQAGGEVLTRKVVLQ
ncbi:MAG: Muc19 precursor [Hymenobacter sp.]|nr:Muc19 precursor [Hymenobacter sp.]